MEDIFNLGLDKESVNTTPKGWSMTEKTKQ
jgi:hypothetical protein